MDGRGGGVFTHLRRGNSQNTQSVTSSCRTSRWELAKSALLPAMTMGISCKEGEGKREIEISIRH